MGRIRKKGGRKPNPAGQDEQTEIILDWFTIKNIQRAREHKDRLLNFFRTYHDELARQRSPITGELIDSLATNARKDFSFSGWQRVVKYKYSLEPLSSRGSLVDPGGRFNVGEINPLDFPVFPALYLAENKETALTEALGQSIDPNYKLSAYDYALQKPDSITFVSLSGQLDSVIDLEDKKSLKAFVELIKNFKLSPDLKREAQELNVVSEPIRTREKLLLSLLNANWRNTPMLFDTPATSQLFGHLVKQAGIEGVLFPSKFERGMCLAVFPENFHQSESFIKLDDPAPNSGIITELNKESWEKLI